MRKIWGAIGGFALGFCLVFGIGSLVMSAQNVEQPRKLNVWRIHTTTDMVYPNIYVYKFQVGSKMKCVALADQANRLESLGEVPCE